MPITIDDGVHTALTLTASNLMKRRKFRLQNVPLLQMNPFCFDLGLETDEVECAAWLTTDEDYDKLEVLKNPVKVTSSTYPEVDIGIYRFEKAQAVRKAGQLKLRECTLTLMRDYWAPFVIIGIIKTGAGVPIEGVTLTMTGAKSKTTKSVMDGTYMFWGLPQGNYVVTPTKTGYSFTPSSRSYTPLSTDSLHQDYTGTAT